MTCDFTEQCTEIQENVETVSKESVTQITEVKETSATSGDVKGDDFIHIVSSTAHG